MSSASTLVPAGALAGNPRSSPLEVIEAFARAVVRPGGNAMLITPDNECDQWVSIRTAVETGSFAVEVRNGLLAVDFDIPSGESCALELAAKAAAMACPSVVVASGQPGHAHAFISVSDPERRACLLHHAKDHDGDVRRTIRPPLAPHRLGLAPRLLLPKDATEALRILRAPPRLSARISALLRDGDRVGRYPSRSEVVQAIASGAANAGQSEECLYRALTDPRNIGGERVQEIRYARGEMAARKDVNRSWQKAMRKRVECTPNLDHMEARRRIDELEGLARRHPWRGLAGGTDFAVIRAHIEIAKVRGDLVHHASVRTIAEQAGVADPTAWRAQHRLVSARWLVRLLRGSGPDQGSLWQLCINASTDRVLDTQKTLGGCEDEC